jgi:hypothetical protein
MSFNFLVNFFQYKTKNKKPLKKIRGFNLIDISLVYDFLKFPLPTSFKKEIKPG